MQKLKEWLPQHYTITDSKLLTVDSELGNWGGYLTASFQLIIMFLQQCLSKYPIPAAGYTGKQTVYCTSGFNTI
jgi:hypothetical protein